MSKTQPDTSAPDTTDHSKSDLTNQPQPSKETQQKVNHEPAQPAEPKQAWR